MQVSLLGSYLDDYSDSEIMSSLWNHYTLTHIQPLPNSAWSAMLSHYRQYMRDGMSDAWVTNEMKRQRANIAGFAMVPTDMQIAAFIATMKQLKANQAVQDPGESPSWSEVWKDSPLNPGNDAVKTALLAAGGLLLLYGIATTATKTLLKR